MKFGLTDTEISRIQNVLKDFPVGKVLIFGSRAKGNFKLSSDIDMVFKESRLNNPQFSLLTHALDDLNLPYEFDLVIYEAIENQEFKSHIDRIAIPFFTSQN